jgi:sugar lactone lactonase YvrE
MKSFRGWGILAAAALALLPLLNGAGARAADADADKTLISPDEMLSVDQVRPGMKGFGKSVFEGTKIERFNVTVLGVLKKIDFGGDMILIRIDDGAPVTSGAGVSAGMSGSPIYIGDKLIGALAFAWSFAKQPVAGVTPIAQMLENYRPGSAPPPPSVAQSGDLSPEGGPLKLDGKLFARATVVPDRGFVPAAAGSTLYMTPVATPVLVSGMGRPGLDGFKQRLGRYSAMVMPGPGKTDLPPAERPKLEPGAAVGVQMLGGDVDATAIGTVTYIKGDHVLAFGHPFFGLGTIDMPMTTAYIHGIISSQEVSFKLGSPVETVGHITQDRNWSIGGRQGEPAKTVQAEFVISDSDRGVKRDYHVQAAVHRDLTPMLLYQSLMNAVSSVSPPSSGTTRGTVEIWPKGMAPIKRENVFSVGERRSQFEELFGDPMAGMPLAEMLQILQVLETNNFGPVPVERLKVTVEVSEKRRTASIERAYADRKRVKPGEKVKVGVVIRPVEGPKEVREFEVEIPRNIPGGRLLIGVSSGSSADRVRQYMQITKPPAKTLAQLVGQITNREQNNDLTIEMAQPVMGVAVSGREFPNLPSVVVEVLTGANPSGARQIRTHTLQTHSLPWVLSGGQLLALQVDADEKDKTGAGQALGATGLGGISSLLDLFRIGLGAGGDFTGDISSDDGTTDGEDAAGDVSVLQGVSRNPFGVAGKPPAARTGSASATPAPDEPMMPSFEELQRLLTGDEDVTLGSEGGEVTTVRKGIGRGPGVWRMRAAKDFQGGKLDGVLVSSRGELALAPQASPLLASPERFFWAQTTDRAGNVYAGGWLDGSIVKIDPAGKLSRFWDNEEEIAITALTGDPDGTLFAAAEPSGTVYRVDASGKSAVLCRLPNQRVWALKRSGDALYAGTGSEGNLYRIGMDGKVSLVFTAPDRHVFALADDGKGTLYCGTYPRGKVFRVREGKVEPVYELPSATVTALACDGKGNLYVGTSPKASVIKITPAGDVTTLFQAKEKHVFSLLADEDGSVFAAVGGQGRVYRISPDRTVSTLWDPQAAYVLSLSRDGSGNLYATTAGPTQIVRLGARAGGSGTFTSTVLNAGNVARWGAVRWTGPGEGVQIETRSGNTAYPDATWSGWSIPYTRAAGEPLSSPAGQYLQYRVVLKSGEKTPAPSLRNLEMFYRARNRAPEVALKSPSSGEVLSGTRAVRWTAKDPDADRMKFDIYYAKEGSEKWVKIGSRSSKPDEEETLEGETSEARLPTAPQLAQASVRPASAVPLQGPKRPVTAAKRRTGKRGDTPNTILHPSSFRLHPSRPVQAGIAGSSQVPGALGGSVTVTLGADNASDAGESGLLGEGPSLNWNTRAVPDGRYRLKVVASDAPTSPDEPATGEALSEWVQVDNTAPRLVSPLPARGATGFPKEIPVKDEGAYVASAEYRIDGGEWNAAAAVDGIFDSPEETLRIDAGPLKPGRHVLEVRMRDAAGNEATAKMAAFIGGKRSPALKDGPAIKGKLRKRG